MLNRNASGPIVGRIVSLRYWSLAMVFDIILVGKLSGNLAVDQSALCFTKSEFRLHYDSQPCSLVLFSHLRFGPDMVAVARYIVRL